MNAHILTAENNRAYTCLAAAKSAAGFGDPMRIGEHAASPTEFAVFLCSEHGTLSVMGRAVREALLGLPVPIPGSPTRTVPPSLFGDRVAGSKPRIGNRVMRNHTQGASAPSVFHFSSAVLRVVTISDEPWFVAADVCSALSIANPSDAIRSLDDDEVTLGTIEGSHRPTNLINEAGLYCLIFKSRKPEAKKFKRWVTHEVLPAIRKTGRYIAKKDKAAPELKGRLRHKVLMAAHGFRYRHKAENALYARIRQELGLSSVTNMTTEECLRAIDLVEQLEVGIRRHSQAVAKAEDDFLKTFVRSTGTMPLKPVLLLMEKDCSREILPIPISEDELRTITTNAVGDQPAGLPKFNQEDDQ